MSDVLSSGVTAGMFAAVTAFFAVLIFVYNFILRAKEDGVMRRVTNLLEDYGGVRGAGEAEDLPEAAKRNKWQQFVHEQRVKTEQNLFAAGLKLSARLWVYIRIGIGVLAFFASFQLFKNPVVSAVIGLAAGLLLPGQILKMRANRRAVKFANELPQVLQVLASGLRSGLSFQQALEVVVEQDKGEVGVQFRQALTEVEYGSDLEAALLRVSERMQSVDLKWLVSALDIQREIGGSLSGILENVAQTIRGRAEVYREVQVLSAEGKLSAYILLALPVLILVALTFMSPKYVSYFWTEPMGFMLIGIFIVLVTIGWFWLKKVVRVEV